MPELPDVEVYVHHLKKRLADRPLRAVRIKSPFVLRTAVPPASESVGKKVLDVWRVGKRIVFGLEADLFWIVHLMIAGRLHFRPPEASLAQRICLASFDFDHGSLVLTEASTKKRASLHLVSGRAALEEHDPGGLELSSCSVEAFRERLRTRTHTLKRALTDPRLVSGVGNAYSDEALHHAKLSPLKRTTDLTDDECARLLESLRHTLAVWTDRLLHEAGDAFPERVTAFRMGMAVHGRFGKPCPDCAKPVQRIRYAENEANYCVCQTGGRLLSDRSLSRLMKGDFPKTLEELESRKGRLR